MFTKTLQVMVESPIRDETGRLHIRQCMPVLHTVKPLVIQKPTTYDIESRLRHQLRLCKIVKGV
jgi:hypothetical protein